MFIFIAEIVAPYRRDQISSSAERDKVDAARDDGHQDNVTDLGRDAIGQETLDGREHRIGP